MTPELELTIRNNRYFDIREDSCGNIYALTPFVYTIGLCCLVQESGCYEYRFCYHNLLEAQTALDDWAAKDFSGEPKNYIKRKG